MLTLLSMALAGEELPDVLPLSATLLVPVADDAARVSVVVVLYNPNPIIQHTQIGPDTLRITDGAAVLSPRWSQPTAEVRPGERLAVFGTVALPPGPHTLRLWFAADGAPAGSRAPDAEQTIEVGHG